MKGIKVIKGDALCLPLEDTSIDAIVTDPPYGLDFMGKAWDKFTPTDFQEWCQLWALEAYRVLKPGGYMLAFGGTRTFHRLTSGIEDAGFEIRDSITWLYGSGFPKSLDISKAIDKATESAKQWEGWGTALKPASEPIVVARKPLAEKTVAANILKYQTGGLNIDATRIATEDKWARPPRTPNAVYSGGKGTNLTASQSNPLGRWPTNAVFSHSEECAEICSDDCPVALVDRQSGVSRFFPVFRYQAKAPSKERPEVNGVKHVTVKPLELMRWLCRLVTPPNGLILDMFAGTGTTGQAAHLEGFRAVLIEKEESYIPLIKERLK